jgi:hypothetical protein
VLTSATTQDSADPSAASIEADTATCSGAVTLVPVTNINAVGSTTNLIGGGNQIPEALTPGTTHYLMETLTMPSTDSNSQGYVNGTADTTDNTSGTAFEGANVNLVSTFVAGQRSASVTNG